MGIADRAARSPVGAAFAFLCLELVITLPFLVIPPGDVRGVPGPLLIVVALVASFVLGPVWGVALTAVSVALAVIVLGENSVAAPLVWLPTAVLVGLVGQQVRRGELLRRELVGELHAGLVALSSAPRLGAFGVVNRYVPAERTQILAGDFYGVLLQHGGSLAVAVGDVQGHGPRAAAIATHLRAAWRGLAAADVDQEIAAATLNEALLAEQSRDHQMRFATLCLMCVESDGENVHIVSAGHPPPLLLTPGGIEELEIEAQGPLGFDPSGSWTSSVIPLPPPPWTIVAYTDGLVEGRQEPDGPRPFGLERLIPLLQSMPFPPTQATVDAVIDRVREANGGPLMDDVVVVAVSSTDPA